MLQMLLLDLELPHPLVQGLVEGLVVLLDFLLQFINPLVGHVWHQLAGLSTSRSKCRGFGAVRTSPTAFDATDGLKLSSTPAAARSADEVVLVVAVSLLSIA